MPKHEGVPGSDYINASYIKVQFLNFFSDCVKAQSLKFLMMICSEKRNSSQNTIDSSYLRYRSEQNFQILFTLILIIEGITSQNKLCLNKYV